jgi:hypothetical protein
MQTRKTRHITFFVVEFSTAMSVGHVIISEESADLFLIYDKLFPQSVTLIANFSTEYDISSTPWPLWVLLDHFRKWNYFPEIFQLENKWYHQKVLFSFPMNGHVNGF